MGQRGTAALSAEDPGEGVGVLRWAALASVGFVAVACVLTAGVMLYVERAVTREPHAAARGFLLDLRARPPRHGQALRRMVPSYQRAHGDATFQNAVQHAPALTTHTADELDDVDVDGDRALVEGELVGPAGRTPIRFELRRLEGYWYIERVLVDGQPVG